MLLLGIAPALIGMFVSSVKVPKEERGEPAGG